MNSSNDFNNSETAKNIHQVSCIVIGGGQRGFIYSCYAKDFPKILKVVGVADPKSAVRRKYKEEFNLTENIFDDWKKLLELKKLSDFAIVSTPDKLHKDPVIALARKGYHILLEKPMATTEKDCQDIITECKHNNVMIAVCHVLRYFPPNKKIKEIIDSGAIGDVVTIQHLEPVGFYHFAHSYVRGNWRNEEESTFSLLAKSCHDIDLLCYWMSFPCKSVSSFGSLNHFRLENKPQGGGTRCTDCSVESSCCYSALKIYQSLAEKGYYGWPVSVVTDVEDLDILTKKLQTGPYGRCVYECDNDVCDNQVVNMEFEGGKTASFTMIAFTKKICKRETKVFGTKGQLTYNGDDIVHQYDFLTKRNIPHYIKSTHPKTSLTGHQGADFQLMDSFVKAVMYNDSSYLQTTVADAVKSHKVVFAAEQSRRMGKTLYRKADDSWGV